MIKGTNCPSGKSFLGEETPLITERPSNQPETNQINVRHLMSERVNSGQRGPFFKPSINNFYLLNRKMSVSDKIKLFIVVCGVFLVMVVACFVLFYRLYLFVSLFPFNGNNWGLWYSLASSSWLTTEQTEHRSTGYALPSPFSHFSEQITRGQCAWLPCMRLGKENAISCSRSCL